MTEPGLDDAQREFDPERDQDAVDKMTRREKGLESDPVMDELGGEPWWRGYTKNSKDKSKPQTKTGK